MLRDVCTRVEEEGELQLLAQLLRRLPILLRFLVHPVGRSAPQHLRSNINNKMSNQRNAQTLIHLYNASAPAHIPAE